MVVCWLALGCLPRGDPPAGRQVLTDVTAQLVGFLPVQADGVVRLLFLRPGSDPAHANLFALSVDPAGGESAELPLLTDVAASTTFQCPSDQNDDRFCNVDARGRVYLSQTLGGDPLTALFLRVDPVTGQATDLGPGQQVIISASGQRVLFFTGSNGAVLYEADDSSTAIPSTAAVRFVGDDLFYLSADGALMRLAAGGVPQQVATGVRNFGSTRSDFLVLTKGNPPSTMPGLGPDQPASVPDAVTPAPASTLDLTTFEETALPGGLTYSTGYPISSDGRWLFASASPSQGALVDRQTGTFEVFDFDEGPRLLFWRPGLAELWGLQLFSDKLWIKRPGAPVQAVPGAVHYMLGFSPDGAYWYSQTYSPGDEIPDPAPPDQVGPADDPAGPRINLTSVGGLHSELHWELSDGRLLVQSFPQGRFLANDGTNVDVNGMPDDFDFQALDPRTGSVQTFAISGLEKAVTPTRFLGILNMSHERGDLTSVDLVSHRSTVLAAQFTMNAVPQPRAPDPYPAGSLIAYQFRARFSSPWDGLWLATAP